METVFKFISVNGNPEYYNATDAPTGDAISMLLAVLFMIVAISAVAIAVFKYKNTATSLHAKKTLVGGGALSKTKSAVLYVIAGLAIVAAVVCAFRLPVAGAFANGNVDFKNEVTVVVHEDTKQVEFESNYITNNTDKPIHIDNSSFKFSEEAISKGVQPFNFWAYDGNTRVYNSAQLTPEGECLPKNQIEIAPGETRNIEYGSDDLTYENALALTQLEKAFALQLNEEPCYTMSFEKNDEKVEGDLPHSQTVSQIDTEGEQKTFVIPGKGNLSRGVDEFLGWTCDDTQYEEGQEIYPTDDMTFTTTWDARILISFANPVGGNIVKEGTGQPAENLVVKPNTTVTPSEDKNNCIDINDGEETYSYEANAAEEGYSFVNWTANGQAITTQITLADNTEISATFEYAPTPTGHTASFEATDGGDVLPKSVTNIPHESVATKSSTSKDSNTITITNGSTPIGSVTATANTADGYEFYKWTYDDGTEEKEFSEDTCTIVSDITFKAYFTYSEHTLTYKVVDVENPHGYLNANNADEEKLYEITETVTGETDTAKGAKAFEFDNLLEGKYKYDFVNWTTEDGSEVTAQTVFAPQKPETGWKDATYIAHFATPRAIYSESGEGKLMKFYYDEEPHNEALYGNLGSQFKFPVNNSSIDLEKGDVTLPSWFVGASSLADDPTPSVYPEKVDFDSSFKNYKGLTSTAMWFMDSASFYEIREMLSSNSDIDKLGLGKAAGDKGQDIQKREIKSINGLNNIYTENITDSSLMFACGYTIYAYYIDKLHYLDLSSWNTPSLTSSFAMFAGCSGLTDIVLPDGTNPNVAFANNTVNMIAMFAYCRNLKDFTALGDFGKSVKYGDYMFAYCSNLKNAKLNNGFGANLDSANSMFMQCGSLQDVDISSFKQHATFEGTYQDMFDDCDNIISFVLPDKWAYSIKNTGYVFEYYNSWYQYNGTSYQEYTADEIDEKLGGKFTRNSAKAVYNTQANDGTLTFYYDHVNHPGTTYYMPGEDDIVPDWYDIKFYFNGDQIIDFTGREVGPESLIGGYFTSDITLKAPARKVVFDSSFATSSNEIYSTSCWFMADSHGSDANCFKEFTGLSNLNLSNVRKTASMFGGFSIEAVVGFSSSVFADKSTGLCDTYGSVGNVSNGSVTLDLSSVQISNSITLKGMFANNTGVTNIILPSNLTITDGSLTFCNCKSLTQITNLEKLQNYDDYNCYFCKMFSGCLSITSIDLSSTSTQWCDKSEAAINMFSECGKLKQLNIGNNWYISLEHSRIPESIDHQWLNNEGASYRASQIPYINGPKSEDRLTGWIRRNADSITPMNIAFEANDSAYGTITPSGSVDVTCDTQYIIKDDMVRLNGTFFKAQPISDEYEFKYWKYNNEKISNVTFFDDLQTISYQEGSSPKFTAVFAVKGYKAKAVYEDKQIDGTTKKALTFYYDNEDHLGQNGESQVFEVKNNTGMNFSLARNGFSMNVELPSWFNWSFIQKSFGGEPQFDFKCSWKIDPEAVVFDESFKDYEELSSISMWFMADHDGNQPVKSFYSPSNSNANITNADAGFANLNTENIKNVAYTFGGFLFVSSFLDFYSEATGEPVAIDAESAAYINQIYAPTDTYGNSITDLDMQGFDFSHIKNLTSMFANCRSLETLDLSNEAVNTSQVETYSGMFANCECLGKNEGSECGITNLDKLNTTNAQRFYAMFYGDCNLKSLDLSHFDMGNLLCNEEGIGAATSVMFTDCFRLNDIKLSCVYQPDYIGRKVSGWKANLGEECGLEDTKDASGNINTWTCGSKTGLSSSIIPFVEDFVDVYSGEFKRNEAPYYSVKFEADPADGGTISGLSSYQYDYIEYANIRGDKINTDTLWCDNVRLFAKPNTGYKFVNWKLEKGFGKYDGFVVVPRELYQLFADQNFEAEHVVKAVFEDANISAKAVYTKPDDTGTASLDFYYDNVSHESENTIVYALDKNYSIDSAETLPPWYQVAGIQPWITSDSRPIVSFNSDIDTGNSERPTTIKVNFASSFKNYSGLTSMSGWFMPGLSNTDKNSLYQPFVFDKNNFTGLNNINTSNIKNVAYMFGGHENSNDIHGSKVTSINLTGFDTEHNIKNFKAMFSGCVKLETLTLPDNFGQNATNMSQMFLNCNSLTGTQLTDVLSKIDASTVEDASFMFAKYRWSSQPVPESDVKDNIEYKFPSSFKFAENVNIDYMFAGIVDAKQITINGGVSTNVGSASHLFANYNLVTSHLEKVSIADAWLNTQYTINMPGLFENCNALNDVSCFDDACISTQSVQDFSYAFNGCSSLESFASAKSFNVSQVNNASCMFMNSGLKTFDFNNLGWNFLQYTYKMFSGCTNLESVDMTRAEDAYLVRDARYMFENCNSLKKVNLCRFNITEYDVWNESEYRNEKPSYKMFVLYDDKGEQYNDVLESIYLDDTWRLVQVDSLWVMSDIDQKPWYFPNDGGEVPHPFNYIYISGWYSTGSGWYTCSGPSKLYLACDKQYWGDIKIDNGWGWRSSAESVNIPFGVAANVVLQSDDTTHIKVQYEGNEKNLYLETSNSTLSKWSLLDKDGKVVCDSLVAGTSYSVSDEYTLKAVLQGGPLMKAYAVQRSDEDTRYNLNIGLFAEDEIPAAAGDKVWVVPEDGDISKDGMPWASIKGQIVDVYTYYLENYKCLVTTKGWFEGCSALERFASKSFAFTKLSSVENMFKGCTSMKSCTLDSNYDYMPTNPVNMNSIFEGCSALKAFSTNIENIGSMTNSFKNCDVQYLSFSGGLKNKDILKNTGIKAEDYWTSCSGDNALISRYQFQDVANDDNWSYGALLKATSQVSIETNDTTMGKIWYNGEHETLTMYYNPDLGYDVFAWNENGNIKLSISKNSSEYDVQSLGNYTIGTSLVDENQYEVYDWKYKDEEIPSDRTIKIENNGLIKVTFGGKRFLQAAPNADKTQLTFYYSDTDYREEGGIEVPLDWASTCSNLGQIKSPFETLKDTVNKVVFDDSFFKVAKIKNAYAWFYNFNKLESIDKLSNLNLTNLSDMRYMFYGCTNLVSVEFTGSSSYNYDDVKTQSMLTDCSNLKKLDLSTICTAYYHDGTDMLKGCSALEQVIFGNRWDKENIKLSKCGLDDTGQKWLSKGLITTLPNSDVPLPGDSEGRYIIASASLSVTNSAPEKADIVGPATTYFNSENGAKAWVNDRDDLYVQFMDADKTSVLFELIYTYKRKSDSKYLFDCWNFNGVNMEPNTYYTITEDATFTAKWTDVVDNKTPKAVYKNDGSDTTFTFYYDAVDHTEEGTVVEVPYNFDGSYYSPFKDYSYSVTKVVFDESFKDCKEIESASHWFARFQSLKAIDNIEYFSSSNVTRMDGMFRFCKALQSLDVSKLNTFNCKKFNMMFYGCSSLTEITFIDTDRNTLFNTCNADTFDSMFDSMTSLKKIDLSFMSVPSTIRSNSAPRLFDNCVNLEEMNLSFKYFGSAYFSGLFISWGADTMIPNVKKIIANKNTRLGLGQFPSGDWRDINGNYLDRGTLLSDVPGGVLTRND